MYLFVSFLCSFDEDPKWSEGGQHGEQVPEGDDSQDCPSRPEIHLKPNMNFNNKIKIFQTYKIHILISVGHANHFY